MRETRGSGRKNALGIEPPHAREHLAAPDPHVGEVVPRMVQVHAGRDGFTSTVRHIEALGRHVETATCQPGTLTAHLLIGEPEGHQVLRADRSQSTGAPRVEEGSTQPDGVDHPRWGQHVQGLVHAFHVMILEGVDEPRDLIFFSSRITEADKIRPFLELETDLVITSNTRHSKVN